MKLEMEKMMVESTEEAIIIEENGLKVEEPVKEETATATAMAGTATATATSTEFFNSGQDYYNDDDDFEWKEEPLVEIHGDSDDSDGRCYALRTTRRTKYALNGGTILISGHCTEDLKEEKNGDEDEDGWQNGGGGGSGDNKNKKKRKKKRKRGDRKGERAFMVPIHECSQCGKKWRTVTELKSHIASHSDVRPFVCEICGQAYKMKKALDIHIGMHNGIHPFVCSYCNKSFTQKVGLEKHLPIHTGVTRFQVSVDRGETRRRWS